jgi:hypothetical protein
MSWVILLSLVVIGVAFLYAPNRRSGDWVFSLFYRNVYAAMPISSGLGRAFRSTGFKWPDILRKPGFPDDQRQPKSKKGRAIRCQLPQTIPCAQS